MQNQSEVEGWPWQPDLCPADEHFIDWIDWRLADGGLVPGDTIFHMGPGLHHNVGIHCIQADLNCFSVTVSSEEFISATYLSIPGNGHYRLMKANINTMETQLLPNFDFMSLFHLGEMADKFGDIDYEQTDKIIRRVNPYGIVFFYTGSSAWDRASKYVQSREFLLRPVEKHFSLALYERIPE